MPSKGFSPSSPSLESPSFVAGEWQGGQEDADGVIHMPWFELSDDASAFMAEVGRGGWVFVFDWMSWEPVPLEEADLEDIRRHLTRLVRGNRFVEGALGEAFESGFVLRLLYRLRELTVS